MKRKYKKTRTFSCFDVCFDTSSYLFCHACQKNSSKIQQSEVVGISFDDSKSSTKSKKRLPIDSFGYGPKIEEINMNRFHKHSNSLISCKIRLIFFVHLQSWLRSYLLSHRFIFGRFKSHDNWYNFT